MEVKQLKKRRDTVSQQSEKNLLVQMDLVTDPHPANCWGLFNWSVRASVRTIFAPDVNEAGHRRIHVIHSVLRVLCRKPEKKNQTRQVDTSLRSKLSLNGWIKRRKKPEVTARDCRI